jgi:hypothetical protein
MAVINPLSVTSIGILLYESKTLITKTLNPKIEQLYNNYVRA